MFRILKTAYFWLLICIFSPLCLIAILLACPFYWLSGKTPDRFAHWVACFWGRWIINLMPGWGYQISGRENLSGIGERFVIVANHESMADIWALFCLNIQFRWLSKIEVFRIPIVGTGMRLAGYIPIRRGDKRSAAEALSRSADWVKGGIPMVYFPEGTRSETDEMRPFKVGAFKLAQETDARILPIVLKGAGDLISKGSPIPNSSTVKIQVLPVLDIGKSESLEEYAARTRNVIQQAHGLL